MNEQLARLRLYKKPKFQMLLWHYTNADESLFDLDYKALKWFQLLVQEAEKR